jgi:hypothetical protein
MSYRPKGEELRYLLTHGDGGSKVKRQLLRESIAEDLYLSREIRAVSTNRQLSNFKRQIARDLVSGMRRQALAEARNERESVRAASTGL